MNILEAAAVKRLALVAFVMGGFVTAHMGLAVRPAEGTAQARTIEAVETVAAPGASASSEYGMGGCGEDGKACATEYCAAPASSNLDGYAVPCGRNAG